MASTSKIVANGASIRRTNSNSSIAKTDLQDKVMINLMKNWLYKHDLQALVNPRIEPLLKKLVKVVRHLLDEFCYASTPFDLFPIVFLHADKFVSSVGYVDQTHLSGILVSSLTVTIKFYEDRGIMNDCVAEACGIKLKDINRMERAFLAQIDFDLVLTLPQITSFFNSQKKAWEERTFLITSSSSSFNNSKTTLPRSTTTFSSSPSTPSITPPKSLARNNSSTTIKPTQSSTKSNNSKSLISSSSSRPNKLMRFTKSWKVLSWFKRPSIE